jgi:class 3 adenylate cyclase
VRVSPSEARPAMPLQPAAAAVAPSPRRAAMPRVVVWALHMALPVALLWLFIARPRFDGLWEHHQAHFWLVSAVALVNTVIGFRMSEEARRRVDARLFLVALAFLCSAGFLALHALATPNVIVSGKNAGFVIATPVGLVLAAGFAAASSVELAPRTAARVMARQGALRIGVPLLLVGWGIVSLLGLPPLDATLDASEAKGPLEVLAVVATVLYLIAAARYWVVHRRRPSVMLLSVITAFFLLAEAMIAVSLARNWRASWWEWHFLMAGAFAFVAYSAYAQYRREGSRTGLFTAISLEQSLAHLREEYGTALEALVSAMDRDDERAGDDARLGRLAADLAARFGLTEGQTRVLERAAEALVHEREQIRRLNTLVAVGHEARVIRSEAELLTHALALASDAFRHDRLRLGLLDQGRLDIGANKLASRALAELNPVEAPVEDGVALVLPLTVKGNPAGVLEVTRTRGAFADRDRAVLRSFSSQLSIALENARLYHQIDALFRQYMSPAVATALLADPGQAELGGATVEVTVLFADLRGFTSFSERATPHDVVAMLNRYFGVAVPVVLAEGGTVSHFMGDAIMVLFNAPTRQPDHALRAARAALRLQAAIDDLAAGHEGWPRFRIGINSGPVLVGNIGSAELRNFTAIGDTANLASRLETSAEEGQIVIGAATFELIRDVAIVRPLGPLQLKGKEAPVEAYVLSGLRVDLESLPRSCRT